MFRNSTIAILSLSAFISGCGDVEDPHDHHEHNHGLPTSAVLNFTPIDGGDTLSFTYAMVEGQDEPEVDTITLDTSVTDYTVSVEIWSDVEGVVEDLTPEISEDDDMHQVLFTGTAVMGPASNESDAILNHVYADLDENGLPVGLSNEMQVLGAGEGELHVMLRHLPTENGEAVKVEGLAEMVAAEGFSAIGGDVDIDVSFPVTITEK